MWYVMSVPLNAFKAACLFSPHKIREIKPDCATLDNLSVFLSSNNQSWQPMKEEYPQYPELSEDISLEFSSLDFWKTHASTYQHGLKRPGKVFWHSPLQLQLSMFFSLLKNSFGDQQLSSLEDYLESSLMLRYNNRLIALCGVTHFLFFLCKIQ